jgi:general secretion pathway protein L
MTKRLSKAVRNFMDWWLSELSAMLPAIVRNWFGHPVPALRAHLSDHEMSLTLHEGGNARPIATVPLEEDRSLGQRRDKLRRSLKRAGCMEKSAAIELTKDQFVSIHLKLPKATREYLCEVLRNEMDRYTPFSEDQVYFDFHTHDSDPESDSIGIDLVLTPRRQLDDWLDKLAALGLDVTYIGPGDDGVSQRSGFNLLPKQQIDWIRRQRLTRITAAVATCFVVISLMAWLPMSAREKALATVDARLTEVRRDADELVRTRKKLEDLRSSASSVQSEKHSRTPVIALLAELTSLLPDDTWLVQMSQSDTELRVAGYSANASSLIELLENSEMLENVRFDAPVTIQNDTSREHFRIVASLETKD